MLVGSTANMYYGFSKERRKTKSSLVPQISLTTEAYFHETPVTSFWNRSVPFDSVRNTTVVDPTQSLELTCNYILDFLMNVSSGELFSCSESGSFSEKMEKISNPSLC
jgi:hypothetical protein